MAIFLFADNARSTVANPVGPGTTTITLSSGGGAAFPSPAAGQQFALTLNDAATGASYETCYCTARAGDNLTVLRGQEGTTAKSWTIGDFAFCGPTAGQQASFVQIPHMTDASIAPVFSNTVVQGTEQVTGAATVGGGLTSTSGLTAVGWDAGGASWRAVTGNYGAMFRNDGATAYLMSTASGSQYGTWNAYRPFSWALNNGAVTIDAAASGTTFGGSTVVNVNSTTRDNSFFGTSGQFYAGPNGVNSLLNFAANQYLQFQPGFGFVFNTTGSTNINAPGGVNVSAGLNAAGNIISTGANILTDNGSIYTNAGGNIFTNGTGSIFTEGGSVFTNGAGNIYCNGSGSIITLGTGQIYTSNGSITAYNGQLRASVASNGDPNAATLLLEFNLIVAGAADSGQLRSYMHFPSGFTIISDATGFGGSPAYGYQTVSFPWAFNNNCIFVICCEASPSGGWAASAAPTVYGTEGLSRFGFNCAVMEWYSGQWNFSLPGPGDSFRYIAIGY